jgi:dihydrofolate reductase
VRLVVTEFMTLDGVIEAPGPGPTETHPKAGWSMAYTGNDIGEFKFKELLAADAQLLGRVTYEGFAAAWPQMQDEAGFADKMNSMPKYVATRTLKDLEWNNSHPIADVPAEVAKLKEQDGGDLLVAGSAKLAHTLAEHGLIDEYRLLVYPVVLGSGQRLFDGDEVGLKLVEAKPYESGVVGLTYAPN